MKPDSAGNVNISSSGGGSNITVDFTLDSTSSNAIANKAVYAALNNKLDKTGTAAAATKATQDSYGNVIVNTTYARKSDLSGYVNELITKSLMPTVTSILAPAALGPEQILL